MKTIAAETDRQQLFAGIRVTSFGTLASRLLGMLRDMATAALFGLSGGGVMDAFVIAFRIPNFFRRLFGEGALAASYLPVLSQKLEEDRAAAWQVASVVLVWLSVVLAAVVVVAEACCLALWRLEGDRPGMTLLLGLTATMMPYLFFICLAAQVSGTLHALAHFSTPALAPTLLNICWLVAVWLIAPQFPLSKETQAYVLAVAVLTAGVLQLAAQLPILWSLGFRFDYNWSASREAVWRIVASLVPMVLGLAITQINTLCDSLLAWALASADNSPAPVPWLAGAVNYPLQPGAVAAIYYGERLYQFPLGLLGMAVATVIFPALSRHAARGQHDRLADDLTLGLRLVLFLGVPASAGLVLLSDPLARLLFEHGEFTAGDASRVARMIGCYGLGVWAYCALPVMVRGFYALGDLRTPVKAGLAAMIVNLLLNLALLWPLAEAGLALSTSVAALFQLTLLLGWFARRFGSLRWRELTGTLLKTLSATAAMIMVVGMAGWLLPHDDRLGSQLAAVVCPLVLGGGIFLAVAWWLRVPEFDLLIARKR